MSILHKLTAHTNNKDLGSGYGLNMKPTSCKTCVLNEPHLYWVEVIKKIQCALLGKSVFTEQAHYATITIVSAAVSCQGLR